jgi:hypothetical protein
VFAAPGGAGSLTCGQPRRSELDGSLHPRLIAMKIIFSDIDGVLNCKRTANPRKFPYIVDPKLVDRLRRVIECTGAQVVLSSTWRYDPAGLFSAKYWGIPFVDVTPDRPREPRRNEILLWLGDHPAVTRYAVLDDEDDSLTGCRSSSHPPLRG